MADDGLHLHAVELVAGAFFDHKAVGRVGLRAEHAVEGLVGVGLERGARDGDHVRVAGGGGSGALPLEGGRRDADVGVRPDAQTVDVGARAAQLVVHVGGKSGAVVVALAEVEDLVGVAAGGGRDGHGVGINEAMRVLRGLHRGRDRGHEGVELHGVLLGGGEVQLHGQHRVAFLDLRGGADHAVVLVGVVGARRGGGGRHGAGSHVIAVNLHTVHVGNDTIAVVKASLVSSHAGNAGKLLAEVLRARDGRSGAQRDLLPVAIREVHGEPVRGDGGGGRERLPLLGLHDGVVKRQGDVFRRHLRHVVLKDDVSVDTRYAHPRAINPGITTCRIDILHSEGILVVGARGETVLVGTEFVGGKGLAGHQFGRSRENHVGLFFGISTALLGNGHVDFVVRADEYAHYNRNYC